MEETERGRELGITGSVMPRTKERRYFNRRKMSAVLNAVENRMTENSQWV